MADRIKGITIEPDDDMIYYVTKLCCREMNIIATDFKATWKKTR